MKSAAFLAVCLLIPIVALAGKKGARAPIIQAERQAGIRICIPRQHTDLLVYLLQAAQTKGFFEEAGVDAQIELLGFRFHGQAGPAANFRVETVDQSTNARGKFCHFSVLSSAGVLAMTENVRNSFTPLMLSEFGKSNDLEMVVAEGSPFNSIKDLKGKIVRVTHIVALMALGEALLSNGMKLNDVAIRGGNEVDHDPTGFVKGAQDAAFMLPMFEAINRSRGNVRVLIPKFLSSKQRNGWPGVFLAVDSAYFDMNPAQVEKVLNAINKFRPHAESHPDVLVKAALEIYNATHKSQLELSAAEQKAAAAAAKLGSLLDFHKTDDVMKAREQMENLYQSLSSSRVKKISSASAWIRELK